MSKAEELFGCKSESKNLHAFQQNLWIAFIFHEMSPLQWQNLNICFVLEPLTQCMVNVAYTLFPTSFCDIKIQPDNTFEFYSQ